MHELLDDIRRSHPASNVLIVCPSADRSMEIMDLLVERGLNPIASTDRAYTALLLAAQLPIDVALVHPQLSGRRSGAELAERLRETWGVDSRLIDAA